VAEVKKKWVCRESQTKGKEAAVKQPNRSSKVKTGWALVHNALNAGEVSTVESNYLTCVKVKIQNTI